MLIPYSTIATRVEKHVGLETQRLGHSFEQDWFILICYIFFSQRVVKCIGRENPLH